MFKIPGRQPARVSSPETLYRGSRCLSEGKPAAGRPGAFGRARSQEGTYLGRGWKRGNQPRHHASFREVSRLLCEPPEHLPTDLSICPSNRPDGLQEHQVLLPAGVPFALGRCRSYFTETIRKSRRVAP